MSVIRFPPVPDPNTTSVSDDEVLQVGRCAFGIKYRGESDAVRAKCGVPGALTEHGNPTREDGLYCATHNPYGRRPT